MAYQRHILYLPSKKCTAKLTNFIMLKQILKINGAKKLNTKSQKVILGGGNCRLCYSNNNGAYNHDDPNCWGCDIPHEL